MWIDRYRNGAIGTLLGRTQFSGGEKLYFGISLSKIALDGTGIIEPSADSGYTRILINNNSESWSTPADGAVHNLTKIQLNEFTKDVGTAYDYFMSETPTGDAVTWGSFEVPRVLQQYTTLYINTGEAVFKVIN